MPRRTPVKELQAEESSDGALRRSSRIAQNSPVPAKVTQRRSSASNSEPAKLTRAKRLSLSQDDSIDVPLSQANIPGTPVRTRLTRSASKSPTALSKALESSKLAATKPRSRRGSLSKAVEEVILIHDSPAPPITRRRGSRSENTSPTSVTDAEPARLRTRRSSITDKLLTQLEKIEEVDSEPKKRGRGRRPSITEMSQLDVIEENTGPDKNEKDLEKDLEPITETVENEDEQEIKTDKAGLSPVVRIEKNKTIDNLTSPKKIADVVGGSDDADKDKKPGKEDGVTPLNVNEKPEADRETVEELTSPAEIKQEIVSAPGENENGDSTVAQPPIEPQIEIKLEVEPVSDDDLVTTPADHPKDTNESKDIRNVDSTEDVANLPKPISSSDNEINDVSVSKVKTAEAAKESSDDITPTIPVEVASEAAKDVSSEKSHSDVDEKATDLKETTNNEKSAVNEKEIQKNITPSKTEDDLVSGDSTPKTGDDKSLDNLFEQMDAIIGPEDSTRDDSALDGSKEESDVLNKSGSSDKENGEVSNQTVEVAPKIKPSTPKKSPLTNISLNNSKQESFCEAMEVDDPPIVFVDITDRNKRYSTEAKERSPKKKKQEVKFSKTTTILIAEQYPSGKEIEEQNAQTGRKAGKRLSLKEKEDLTNVTITIEDDDEIESFSEATTKKTTGKSVDSEGTDKAISCDTPEPSELVTNDVLETSTPNGDGYTSPVFSIDDADVSDEEEQNVSTKKVDKKEEENASMPSVVEENAPSPKLNGSGETERKTEEQTSISLDTSSESEKEQEESATISSVVEKKASSSKLNGSDETEKKTEEQASISLDTSSESEKEQEENAADSPITEAKLNTSDKTEKKVEEIAAISSVTEEDVRAPNQSDSISPVPEEKPDKTDEKKEAISFVAEEDVDSSKMDTSISPVVEDDAASLDVNISSETDQEKGETASISSSTKEDVNSSKQDTPTSAVVDEDDTSLQVNTSIETEQEKEENASILSSTAEDVNSSKQDTPISPVVEEDSTSLKVNTSSETDQEKEENASISLPTEEDASSSKQDTSISAVAEENATLPTQNEVDTEMDAESTTPVVSSKPVEAVEVTKSPIIIKSPSTSQKQALDEHRSPKSDKITIKDVIIIRTGTDVPRRVSLEKVVPKSKEDVEEDRSFTGSDAKEDIIKKTPTKEIVREKRSPRRLSKESARKAAEDDENTDTPNESNPKIQRTSKEGVEEKSPKKKALQKVFSKGEMEEAIEDSNISDVTPEEGDDMEPANEFIDDMAEEGEEDTPSEGSNDLVFEGESINSSDTYSEGDGDSYEDDSFIDDDEEKHQLLSGEEEFLRDSSTEKVKNQKKKKSTRGKAAENRKRILAPSESEDEATEDITSEAREAVADTISIENAEVENEQIEETNIEIEETTKQLSPELLPSKNDVVDVESDSESEAPKLVKEEDQTKVPTSPDKKSNRKSSITIQENIKLEDVQDGELSARISSVVDWFYSGIKAAGESGKISLNVSLDYADESTNEPKADDTGAEPVNDVQEPKKRRSSVHIETASPKTVETAEDDVFVEKKKIRRRKSRGKAPRQETEPEKNEGLRKEKVGFKRLSTEEIEHLSPKQSKQSDFVVEDNVEAKKPKKNKNRSFEESEDVEAAYIDKNKLAKAKRTLTRQQEFEEVEESFADAPSSKKKNKRKKAVEEITVERKKQKKSSSSEVYDTSDEKSINKTSKKDKTLKVYDFSVEYNAVKKKPHRQIEKTDQVPSSSGILKKHVVSKMDVSKREVDDVPKKAKRHKRKASQKLLPTKSMVSNDLWECEAFDTTLRPSKSNKKVQDLSKASKKKKTDVDSFAAKDFKNRMLYDSTRILRMDTKELMKRKKM